MLYKNLHGLFTWKYEQSFFFTNYQHDEALPAMQTKVRNSPLPAGHHGNRKQGEARRDAQRGSYHQQALIERIPTQRYGLLTPRKQTRSLGRGPGDAAPKHHAGEISLTTHRPGAEETLLILSLAATADREKEKENQSTGQKGGHQLTLFAEILELCCTFADLIVFRN
jgi:hypothetical protein